MYLRNQDSTVEDVEGKTFKETVKVTDVTEMIPTVQDRLGGAAVTITQLLHRQVHSCTHDWTLWLE